MSKPKDVINFRRRIKLALIQAFGDECQICHNSYEPAIYEFHHINPELKSFGLGSGSTTRAKADYAKEAKKCCMVCANCHRLIEYGDKHYNLINNFNEEIYYNTLKELTQHSILEVEKAPKVKHELPSREQLKQDIRTMSFLAIGRKYSVSDNAIRKWCVKMNLPNRASDIKLISDEDWINI
jgi:hypothetical protein